jgi:hypothetical protein
MGFGIAIRNGNYDYHIMSDNLFDGHGVEFHHLQGLVAQRQRREMLERLKSLEELQKKQQQQRQPSAPKPTPVERNPYEAETRQNRLRAANGKQLIALCSYCNQQLAFDPQDTGTTAKCIACNQPVLLRCIEDIGSEPEPLPPEVKRCVGHYYRCPNCSMQVELCYYRGHKWCVVCNGLQSQSARVNQTPTNKAHHANPAAQKPMQTGASSNRELTVACPHCAGRITYGTAAYGGRVIDCPHCSKSMSLPK